MAIGTLWENIEALLKEKDLPLRQVSLMAGLHPDAVRAIKNGKMPSADRLQKIAQVLETTPAKLLGVAEEAGTNPLKPNALIAETVVRLNHAIMHQLFGATLKSGRSFNDELEHRIASTFDETSALPDKELALIADILYQGGHINTDEAVEMVKPTTSRWIMMETIIRLVKTNGALLKKLNTEEQIAEMKRIYDETQKRREDKATKKFKDGD